jgi:hypothetical protein
MLSFALLSLLSYTTSAALTGSLIESCHGADYDCITASASNKKVCHVGSIDFYQIGVANTSISWWNNQNPTWTQGLTNLKGIGVDNLTDYGQHFLLGMPPPSSSSQAEFSGCALFFNVTALAVSDPKQTYNPQCSAYLGAQCQSDLLAQANDVVQGKAPVNCLDLAAKLNANAPSSCTTGVTGGSWGGIQAASSFMYTISSGRVANECRFQQF